MRQQRTSALDGQRLVKSDPEEQAYVLPQLTFPLVALAVAYGHGYSPVGGCYRPLLSSLGELLDANHLC